MNITLKEAAIVIISAVLFYLALVSFAAAQVAIPWVGNGNHQPHDYSFGPIQVPPGATVAHVVFDGTRKPTLNGIDEMRVQLFLSQNGGASFSFNGGDNFNAGKQPSDFSALLSQPGNAFRILQGTLTLYGGPGKFKVDVVLE